MDITIKNLAKHYGLQTAVDHIDMQVKTGEVLGFLGPNGAGKTTTMKMVCGLIAPDEGSIEIGGISVQKNPSKVKELIGYLPENNPLYEDMPVLDLLRFTADIQGVPKDRTNERIKKMVEACGLGDEKHKRIGELSKGYRQRVGMAQAMVHDPEVLILDEPTTGLDPNQIVEIRKLIKQIGKEKTVILSTHILPEVEATCDRILIINKGKIVADGSPGALRKQAQGRSLIRTRIEGASTDDMLKSFSEHGLFSSADILDNGLMELATSDMTTAAREVFRICVAKNWTLLELTPIETRLEDVFRDLTLN
jgi:ABC-2 type transport system ATP-binding protein